ncbi:MAG: ATP-binding protein [Bacteroidales bacterium]|jgi:hypothetical protein|nr:ATP-binding protein [Bacteroidales bacterium]
MKNKVTINDKSVDSAGLPKDYMHAIAELIWNGFDAGASEIKIDFETNEVDTLNQIRISDNGYGIALNNLSDTFGAFLDSQKKDSFQRSSYIHGKHGKGRFAFAVFAGKATWHTVITNNEILLEYEIGVSKSKKEEYEVLNKKISKEKNTGTVIVLNDLFNVTAYSFTCKDFKDFLAKEFGWFLFLNRNNEYSIKINDVNIEYQYIISDNETIDIELKDEDQNTFKFLITYIRWKETIGDKYYYYFLNGRKRESAKQLTSFNNNAIDFHHSVYIESDFFNKFVLSSNENNLEAFNKNQSNPVFKTLVAELHGILSSKEKKFIRENAANKLIVDYEASGVIPKFNNNRYEQERRKDLVDVVKELYCVQPKIFKGLKKEQQKTFIGFLNLLLDTDEREQILEIIEGIAKLTKEERTELSNLLKKTSFSKIIRTIKLIENRYKVIDLLRVLVFDLNKFTTERKQLQIAIQENYWLFGEQFHIVSADETFEKALSNYLYIVDGIMEKAKIKKYDKNRRPDIFICRKRTIPAPDDNEYQMEENIMVELKRPTVPISKKELRQIEDYMEFIINEQQFNSQLRRWKFFAVSNKVDGFIKQQYEAFKDKGKKFLVKQVSNYELYAMTWDDVFTSFEIKHKYILDKLEFDRNAIQEELNLKGISLTKESAQKVVSKIVQIAIK